MPNAQNADARELTSPSRLCFLTLAANIRGAVLLVVVACVAATGAGGCGSRALDAPKSDAGTAADSGVHPTNVCANVGCSAPPLCSQGCQAACGCCPCAEGERNGSLTCRGGCYVPDPNTDGGDAHTDGWIVPAACLLPFEVGPCDALFPVYAYVNGACVPRTYGGCQGNANRFSTLEECLATCEGRPAALPCPTGRVAKQICVACGPAGGCAKSIVACALTCDPAGERCPSPLPVCYDGVCQNAGCD